MARKKLHPSIQKNIRPLWPHQKQSIKFFANKPKHLDLSDPGTAKTRVQLEMFADRRRNGGKCALVLAPKSLLEPAWAKDAAEFVPDMRCSIAYATNREAAFKMNADIYITNTDAVKWLEKQPKKFFDKFDTLIIDELIAFKHKTSARSKALANIAQRFDYRSGLNGTLTSGRVSDAWHQIFIIDDGDRLGVNFYRFRSLTHTPKLVDIGRGKTVTEWVEKEGAIEAVASMISDISIRHAFEDVMDVPENYSRSVVYDPPDKLMAAYKEMAENAILELSKSDVVAVNAAVLRNKLLQIASGAVYDETGKYRVLDTSRYELVLAMATEVDHSVVFFNWQHQKDQLLKAADKANVAYALIDGTVKVKDRNRIVENYQAGKYQVLFLHPKTGAHGLTLTKGTRTIWSSPIYEPDFLKQGMHRIYRGGQKKKTETILVEANNTVEQRVYAILNEKNQKMLDLLGLLTR